MSKKKKSEKVQRQLEINQLDEMLWLSTPLGKFMSSINRQAKKIFPSSRPNKYTQRAWVVRIPAAFIFTGSNTGGFQTIVMAKTRDQAWEEAAKSEEWEILNFFISHMKVFPKEPF